MGLFKNKKVNLQRSTKDTQKKYDAMYEQASTFWDWADEAHAWAQEQFGAIQPTFDNLVNDLQQLANTNIDAGDDFYNRYWNTYAPVEDAFIQKAMDYDSPEYQAARAARAQADAAAGFDAQYKEALRELEGYGVDRSQAANQAMDRQYRAARAAEVARTGNEERLAVQDRANAMQLAAANLGQQQLAAANAANTTQLNELNTKAGILGQAGATSLAPYLAFANNLGNYAGLGATGVEAQNAALQGKLAAQEQQNANMMLNRGGGFMGGIGTLIGTGIGAMAGNPGFGYQLGGALFGEKGGPVPDLGYQQVPGTTDSTPAVLTPGEFIVDKPTVAWVGYKKLIEQAEKAKMEQQQWAQQQQQQAIPV